VSIGGNIIGDPSSKADALGAAWARTFSANPAVDCCKAREFLNTHAKKYDLAHMRIPDVNDISIYLQHVKNTAPGPDGTPYAGWLAAGHPGAVTLHNVLVHMHCGFAMPFDFYASLGEFLPKGECEDDLVEVVKPPAKNKTPKFEKTAIIKLSRGQLFQDTANQCNPAPTSLKEGSFRAGISPKMSLT